MRKPFNFYIVIIILFGIKDCVLAQTPSSNSKHIIEIKNMKFIPSELVIKKGDTIIWVNRDFFVHNITNSDNNKWSSPNLAKDESWEKVITENINYYCSLHVIMKGKLIIKN